MSISKSSIAEMSDAQLYRFGQDKTAEIFQAMEKAGNDAVKGTITPEQSDIDIGRLMDELKIIQSQVGAERTRRQKNGVLKMRLVATVGLLAIACILVLKFRLL